ncbi:RES family NAD+ phosphorylase [Oceanithermus sp.]
MASIELRLWRAYDPDRPYAQKSDFDPLSGEGASFVSGRWHTARSGVRIVYASEHPALALLELYVNIEQAMHRYTLIEFVVWTPGVSGPPAKIAKTPNDERATRAFGNTWYTKDPNPVLKVPSVLVPKGFNYLIRKDGTVRLKRLAETTYQLDSRLAGRL